MRRKTSVLVFSAVVAGCVTAGAGSGAALAGTPAIFSPAGVSSTGSTPMPAPQYPQNTAGQTFGSAAVAPSADEEPDLVAAETTDGREGYVLKSDLDDANGTTAAKTFKSPQDALAWQTSEAAQRDHLIPVYAADGRTVIGSFLIVGHRSQALSEPDMRKAP
jgi:hypothetical protein